MINYTTTDFINEFGADQISEIIPGDDDNGIDNSRLQYYIEMSESLVRSYLKGKYPKFSESVTEVPSLKFIMGDIVFYKLQKNTVTDAILERFRYAIKYLEGIRDGKIFLTDQDGNTINPNVM